MDGKIDLVFGPAPKGTIVIGNDLSDPDNVPASDDLQEPGQSDDLQEPGQ